jgi:hypothetical protein
VATAGRLIRNPNQNRAAGKCALSDTLLIIVAQHLAKMNNHDFRALVFGVGREVAINRGIPILPTITTNHNDLPGPGSGFEQSIDRTRE